MSGSRLWKFKFASWLVSPNLRSGILGKKTLVDERFSHIHVEDLGDKF
jgi:hypothetical protein